MLINNFGGGLNIAQAPSLLSAAESTIDINVNHTSSILRPIKKHTKVDNLTFNADGSFYYFNGSWYSTNAASKFVLFNSWLYYYKDGKLLKSNGVITLEAGIVAPSESIETLDNSTPTISIDNASTGSSDLVQETKLYKIIFINDQDEYLTITREFEYTGLSGIEIAIESDTNIRTILVQRYYNGGYYVIKTKIDNTLTFIDSIEDISNNDTFNTVYLDTADVRQYCYTYYRSTDDSESAPSELSDEVSTLGDNITINNIVPSTDTTVTNIKIYRIGGDLNTFMLVDTIDKSSTTYTDIKTDSEVVNTNEVLLTSGTIKPIDDLSCLTLHNSSLFGINGNKICFSTQGQLDNWNPFYDITLEDIITGIGVTQNGLLIFLKNKTYILTGDSASNYSVFLLSDSQGCVASVTIQYAKNTLIWLSLDGFCASTGGDIQVISEATLGKLSLSPRCSAFYDNKYFLSCDDTTYIVDFIGSAVRFYNVDLVCNGLYYNTELDSLYFILNDDLSVYTYSTDSANDILHYQTGWLTDGSLTNIKTYKNIYLYCIGTLTFNLYSDGLLVNTYELTEGFNEIQVPVESLLAYYLQFEFIGTGEIHEIEYKLEERQNAR